MRVTVEPGRNQSDRQHADLAAGRNDPTRAARLSNQVRYGDLLGNCMLAAVGCGFVSGRAAALLALPAAEAR